MRVLLEVPHSATGTQISHFSWLKNENNLLFIMEDWKKMRTISTILDPGKELQSATLIESKVCTSLSWNKDGSLLALVIDKHQVYFWEVKTNNFSHFKPKQRNNLNVNINGKKTGKTREIDLIAWSKVNNRFVICYSSGQLLLCTCKSTISEKFIDNSDGVLKKIAFIECSEYLDMFVCITIISEVLVMNFEGEALFYMQDESCRLLNGGLSPPNSEIARDLTSRTSFVWLTYYSSDGTIFFKQVLFNDGLCEMISKSDAIYKNTNEHSLLVNTYWLNNSQMLACYSSGDVVSLQMKCINNNDSLPSYEAQATVALNIRQDKISLTSQLNEQFAGSSDISSENSITTEPIVYYGLSRGADHNVSMNHSLVAITNYQIYYYEMFEDEQDPLGFSFEKVDDLDLSSSLQKVKLNLIKVEWSNDCSMLAVQLSSGHLLVYRTRLPDLKVATHGARAAYLSAPNEVTLLNYEPIVTSVASDSENDLPSDKSETSEGPSAKIDNAVVVKVDLKPSVIAVGPNHLALALNNRVRFYHIVSNSGAEVGPTQYVHTEDEYASIVIGLSLNSIFAAIHFDDGRLKLQAIPQSSRKWNEEDYKHYSDERFFPDPSNPERITSFVLTQDLLLFCTRSLIINVFSLDNWTIVQTFDHSVCLQTPIDKIKSNCYGNKFICLTNLEDDLERSKTRTLAIDAGNNASLYDLYMNNMIRFFQRLPTLNDKRNYEQEKEHPVKWDRLMRSFERELITCCSLPASAKDLWAEWSGAMRELDGEEYSHYGSGVDNELQRKQQFVRLVNGASKDGKIMDAIWDIDGRTAFLIERKRMHIVVVVEHTLAQEEPMIEYVASTSKGSTYTTLYASQGILSFQTCLGRVINSVLESHDDELKLANLERQIHAVRVSVANNTQSIEKNIAALIEITKFKLIYLKGILLINSLSKCKEICEHLISDEQFNLPLIGEELSEFAQRLEQILWLRLADWALYTMNLEFALLIYRKHRLPVLAHALDTILIDLRFNGIDSKSAIKARLSELAR